MVSPELLRRYPLFADFSMEQIVTLAKSATEKNVVADEVIFHEGEMLTHFYIVRTGKIGILISRPDPTVSQPVSLQLTGNVIETHTVVSTAGPGEVFGWSALVSPHIAMSSGRALLSSQIVAFDCRELQKEFEKDCQFGFLLMKKIAQVIRGRLRDLRIESLSLLEPQG